MRDFVELYTRLDETNATNEKVAAMVDYFTTAKPDCAAWAIHFLTGERLKRLVTGRNLREWVVEASGYPSWLVEECYSNVGDSAETIALLLDDDTQSDTYGGLTLRQWIEDRLLPLRQLDEQQRKQHVFEWWRELPTPGRFVLNKLMTGAMRVGVSRRLVIRAIAQVAELDTAVIAHRLMGRWKPSAKAFRALISEDDGAADDSRPYPFFLASPIDGDPENLGELQEWHCEWKWDGIRAQLIRRGGATYIWSRGEELLEGRFPEIESAAEMLPDGTVIDGELLAWENGAPLPFSRLQRRIGRLKPSDKMQAKHPVSLLAYDLLEHDGIDLREVPLDRRRELLIDLLRKASLDRMKISEEVEIEDWKTLRELHGASRDRGVEGFILKRRNSPYRTGRTRGDWWKWKVDPFTIDAVLLYAQPGSGRRSNLLTDYTFAVWDGDALVPVAKAYSGLENREIERLDKWIRRHTRERFGPVRSVEVEHVFEIAFEGINASSRHKSGIALRFPRIARWREDLAVKDADHLDQVKQLLHATER